MAGHVGRPVHVDVEGERHLGHDRHKDRCDEQPENARVKRGPRPDEQQRRCQQNGGDDIFADNLECGQACSFDVRGREHTRHEDKHQQAACRCSERQKNEPLRAAAQPSFHKHRGHEERCGLHAPRGYPQLRGQVGAGVREYPHAFVGERVHHVDAADKEIGDAQEQETAAAQILATVPDDEEERPRDRDAEHLDQSVEERIVVPAGNIQAGHERRPAEHGESLGIRSSHVVESSLLASSSLIRLHAVRFGPPRTCDCHMRRMLRQQFLAGGVKNVVSRVCRGESHRESNSCRVNLLILGRW